MDGVTVFTFCVLISGIVGVFKMLFVVERTLNVVDTSIVLWVDRDRLVASAKQRRCDEVLLTFIRGMKNGSLVFLIEVHICNNHDYKYI